MYKVAINAPFSFRHRGWVDHLGAPINRLIFSKEYHEKYERGHYPIDSFGTLDRTIDDFRESPLQSLTVWKIRIPSMYSSKDGSFQTVDLFYWLEDINEKNKKKFNLIGCEAVLLENDDVIYRGVVNSVANGTGGTTISIGESIGSPQIKKSDFPIALGNTEMSSWPVKFEKSDTGQDIIKISDRRLKKKPQFFLKMEEDKFIPVSFVAAGLQTISFSDFFREAHFRTISTHSLLPNDINVGEHFLLSDLNSRSIYRPTLDKDTPDDYTIGDGDDVEYLQAWSDCNWRIYYDDVNEGVSKYYGIINLAGLRPSEPIGSYTTFYSLGRSPKQFYHSKGKVIRGISNFRANQIEAQISISPTSLVVVANSVNCFTTGNPSAFLDASKSLISLKKIDWENHPKIRAEGSVLGVKTSVNFPELNLPEANVVSCIFCVRIKIPNANPSWSRSLRYYFGNNHADVASKNDGTLTTTFVNFNTPIPIAEMQKIIIGTYNYNPLDFTEFILGGIQLHLTVRMPYDAGKLYASGEFLDSNSSNSGESLIPAMCGLLGLLELTKSTEYEVNAVGELDGNKYGTIINNEAVAFRDKLRNLASESATLVRFSPIEKEFLVKSISRQFDPEITPIPLDAIVLENNMYDFRMESSHRDDILNGISISWGKNPETDKYEHSLYIDGQRILRDGKKWNEMLEDGKMGKDKWKEVRGRLTENFSSNVGIVKSIDAEWIMDWDGAELFAFNYLCWNCAHLRKAQIKCITSVLRTLKSPVMEESIDIGSFIRLKLPGYPEKLTRTTWVITGILSDLDNMVSTVELLEAWGIEAK
ncbi:MAG: hypothetical protein LBU89_01020, partial [Fibromonadaceae bacterium]|nr:hypothetical protein [Fibromonadaceae bacterium]